MKTERVTILATPEFKAFLSAEAEREGLSVAELVRSRCERRPSDDEAVLQSLAAELRQSVMQAKKSLREGLQEARDVILELRTAREQRTAGAGRRSTAAAASRKVSA
jgi:hypothetical protein